LNLRPFGPESRYMRPSLSGWVRYFCQRNRTILDRLGLFEVAFRVARVSFLCRAEIMGSIGQVAESSDLRNSDWSYLQMTGFVCFYHLQGQQDKTGHLRTLKGV